MPPNRISQIITGKRAITGDTALRLGHWFRNSAQFTCTPPMIFALQRQRSSLDEIRQMRAKGQTKKTPADAPEIELDEAFWSNAAIVETNAPRKTDVHLRVDPETFEFFRAGGKGHLTRMAKVLKAYAQSHSVPPGKPARPLSPKCRIGCRGNFLPDHAPPKIRSVTFCFQSSAWRT